ncbi:lysine-specific demethylase JMJ25-like isoform X2 [Sesamum indicum]|uniref:Lysine-specific demethylase JMJ25-like isoform X2 n=1 Tax=Sesamum indicum TaxID=4182 RepID=A0A6I9UWX3_SESIN|nr:lysine-specific demethylase JMJ25-like isoform X2 [Sesamum indicum]
MKIGFRGPDLILLHSSSFRNSLKTRIYTDKEGWGLEMKKRLKPHGNENKAAVGNMLMKGSKAKKKRSDSNNCHQCHRRDKERVVRCTKCNQKNYCIPCITRWYPTMEEIDCAEACPVCRDICNCAACLQSNAANKDLIPDVKLCTKDKVQHSRHIVRAILPYLKQFVAEQNMEREEEARIQGLSVTGLQIPRANFSPNDQVQCDKCKTSIFDVHRSCLKCSYKLCVTCCREIRGGFLPGSTHYQVHDVIGNFIIIVCPPESMGGCDHGNLELKSIYPDKWVSELLKKAESIAEMCSITDSPEASEGACSCLRSYQGSEMESAKLCEAASREDSNDNFLYCPSAVNIGKLGVKHFQWHLYKGEPVIIRNVLSGTAGLSWEPLVMWRACRKSRKTNHLHILEFQVRNCLNWCEETINMHQFFKGYSDGLFDSEGQLKILKLEDWPPAESFEERLPRHCREFFRCLPFRHYTLPHAGYLNMSTKLPEVSLKPDLGPKMCISYGADHKFGFGSVTMLQYALSDTVNVLMHTAAICVSAERLSMMEQALKSQQGEMLKDKGKRRYNPSIVRNRIQEFEDPESGAVWDIFRRQDVPKLEDYLREHYGEFRHIDSRLQQLVHPIHDKAFYLTEEHKRSLIEEYGIEPWTFVQKLGDAVFVPAGCPYQIRNLKSCTSVAVNFVSPESVGECIRLSREYRSLPYNHRSKEDKLQVKKMAYHAMRRAVKYLENATADKSRSRPTPPLALRDVPHVASRDVSRVASRDVPRVAPRDVPAVAPRDVPILAPRDVPQNPAMPEIMTVDLGFIREDLEAKKMLLDREGHFVAPQRREYLDDEINNLLDIIYAVTGPAP